MWYKTFLHGKLCSTVIFRKTYPSTKWSCIFQEEEMHRGIAEKSAILRFFSISLEGTSLYAEVKMMLILKS